MTAEEKSLTVEPISRDVLRSFFVLAVFLFSLIILILVFMGWVNPVTDTQKSIVTIATTIFGTVSVAGVGKWLFPQQEGKK
jgi:hypothetical protein